MPKAKAKAKRMGWDEHLSAEEEFDLEPYSHENDDLEGELVEKEIPASKGHPAFKLCLVGGQEADPKTVEVLDETTNAFCPTGQGGGVDPTCSPAHTALRSTLDTLGIEHSHLSDEELHSALKSALTPKKGKEKVTPTGEHIDKSEKEVQSAIDEANKADESLHQATQRADRVTKELREKHSPEEVQEIARRITGKKGRGVDQALKSIHDEMTALAKVLESQKV